MESWVWGLLCHILHFIVRHTVSVGDKSAPQASQSSAQTVLLQSDAVVMYAEYGWDWLAEISNAFPGKETQGINPAMDNNKYLYDQLLFYFFVYY